MYRGTVRLQYGVPAAKRSRGQKNMAVCTFELELCSSTQSVETKALALESFPERVLDIKQHIEKEFNIPVYSQVIRYDSVLLKDSDDLRSLRIRTGDTLHVTFEAKAECADVCEVKRWLDDVAREFEDHLPSLDVSSSPAQRRLVQKLDSKLFEPFTSETKQMNKKYFVEIGGLKALYKVYSLILKQERSLSPLTIKKLELVLLKTLFHLSATFEIRQAVIPYGCVELCMQSFVRVEVKKGNELHPIDDNRGYMAAVLQSAIETLCNMCEVPEAHATIAANSECLKRFIWAAHNTDYQPDLVQLVICMFFCLGLTAETHQYLSSPEVISGVIDTCRIQKESGITPMDLLFIEYFVQLILSQLVLVSPTLLPPSLYDTIHQQMSQFLAYATPSMVAEKERLDSYYWSVLLPFAKLMYAPTTFIGRRNNRMESMLSSLQLLGIESAIFCLQCFLCNSELGYVETLQKEELIDYFVCLPGHIPPQLQEKARTLVASLGTHVQLQPPSLVVLARAKLAKMHFGLEKIFHVCSRQELDYFL